MEDNKGIQVRIDRTKVLKSPNFVDIYANDTYIQTSPWDVRLMFAVMSEHGPDQSVPSPIRVADVRLSLHHAKKVAQLLTEQIQNYERANGTLALPTPQD